MRSHCITQCFPYCVSLPCVRLCLNMRSHCITQCFPYCVSLPCVRLYLNMRSHTVTQCFPVLRLPSLRPPVSQYALTLYHAVFSRAASPFPASACISICAHTLSRSVFPYCVSLPCVRLCLNMRSYCITQCFPVLRLPSLRPPTSQCAPGLSHCSVPAWDRVSSDFCSGSDHVSLTVQSRFAHGPITVTEKNILCVYLSASVWETVNSMAGT